MLETKPWSLHCAIAAFAAITMLGGTALGEPSSEGVDYPFDSGASFEWVLPPGTFYLVVSGATGQINVDTGYLGQVDGTVRQPIIPGETRIQSFHPLANTASRVSFDGGSGRLMVASRNLHNLSGPNLAGVQYANLLEPGGCQGFLYSTSLIQEVLDLVGRGERVRFTYHPGSLLIENQTAEGDIRIPIDPDRVPTVFLRACNQSDANASVVVGLQKHEGRPIPIDAMAVILAIALGGSWRGRLRG